VAGPPPTRRKPDTKPAETKSKTDKFVGLLPFLLAETRSRRDYSKCPVEKGASDQNCSNSFTKNTI